MKTFGSARMFCLLGVGLLGLFWGVAYATTGPVEGIFPQEIEEAAKQGRVTLSHIPLFLFSYARGTLQIAGILATIFVMIGGIQYVLGGLTDNKEQGKKTITYAIMGVVLILLSWFIVDFFYQMMT